MPVKMPGAAWRPIDRNYGSKRATTRAVVLHVDAGNASSLHGWFSRADARASSHFFVKADGEIEQYLDADITAWTSGEGNATTIGVETQGLGEGEWTAGQVESLAKIAAWAHETYGVPLRLMESSKAAEQGLGWHRLGVDGNFPATGILRGRNQRGGGEVWSKSRGKECPGDDRIKQMPEVLARATQLATGRPTSAPKPKENDDMANTTSGAPLWNGRRMGTVCSYADHRAAGREIAALGFQVKESNEFKPLDSRAHSSWRKGGWHYAYGGTGAFDINWLHEGANSSTETMLIDLYVIPILRKHGVKGVIHKPRNRNDHKTWCHADRGAYNDYTVRTYTAAQKKQAAALIAKYRTGGGGGSASKPSKPSKPSSVTVLRYGDKGAAVKTLQRQLNQVGGDIKVDGSYGKATLATVKSYQKREGLKVDGIAGPATQAKLASQQPKPLAVDGLLGKATIKAWQEWMGTTVDGVISKPSTLITAVQKSLNRQHGWDLDEDGRLGPNTIKALQIHYGTTADGKTSVPSEWVKALQRTLNRNH